VKNVTIKNNIIKLLSLGRQNAIYLNSFLWGIKISHNIIENSDFAIDFSEKGNDYISL